MRLIFVDGLSQGLLDFDVAPVRELRGIDPRLFAKVEVVPLLDGIDGLLDFLGNFDDVSSLRDARVVVRGVWGSRRARYVSDFPDVGKGGVSPPSSGGGDKEEVFLRILPVFEPEDVLSGCDEAFINLLAEIGRLIWG